MKVTLPDGTPLELPEGATGADAAAAIGAGLARAALAIRFGGEMHDLSAALPDGAEIEIVTAKSGEEDGGGPLWLVRHDAAHVLATAVMEMHPGVKISIGPPIEDGFYYDFEFPDGVSLSDADFETIEQRMREHIKADEAFERADASLRVLTRVYGTAFLSKDALEEHLERLEQAGAGDHRKLGRELDLFMF